MPSGYLVHNAARVLNVPERTVRHWAATGKLEATREGERSWRISRDAVAELRAQLEVSGKLPQNDGGRHDER